MSLGRYESQKRWRNKNPELFILQKQNRDKDKHNKNRRDLLVERQTLEIDESLAKPWNDKESLFCDGEFLTRPIKEGGLGLNIRNGKECKDGSNS